jgi:succinylglutamic semialdehyde dehydrogenase
MDFRGNFIEGNWSIPGAADGELARHNPARPDEEVFRAPFSVDDVDRAVAAARAAQPAWDRLGFEARGEYLGRLAEAFDRRREELARRIAREVGKPLWEARGEASALSAKIEIMRGPGARYTAPHQPQGVDGRILHRPLGVVAVLGPFNFPLHLPNGHIVPALLQGNCVVVKPSELAGGCMQLYTECIAEAGLPPGVFNVVHGDGSVGAPLAAHRDVDGVLFTGSWETGLRIREATLEQPGKLLALEMGGKNTSIVLDDADLDQAARAIVTAAFQTTGQRCSATSRVVVDASIEDDFLDRFLDLTRRVTVGDPLDEERPPFMGPLVDRRALDRFVEAQRDDEDGNLEPLLRGGLAAERDGHFVTPAVWRALEVDRDGSHQARELFGPDVVVYTARDDREAARIANATDYGLAMAVFGSERARFDELCHELECGVLNFNRSTAGASSRLPFGGIKRSGNHRPSAVTAGLYCTYRQAQLHVDAGSDEESLAEAPLRYLSEE